MYRRKGRFLGGILLVAGTTIGAGMLALPVLTGLAGFFPTIILLIIYWALMTFTALLILEVNLWFPSPVNLISMARYTLGKGGESISWGIYLLLLYALTAAYLAASGPLISQGTFFLFGYTLPVWAETFPFLIIFGAFIYLGTRPVDYINRIFMIGLAATYVILIAILLTHVDLGKLHYSAPFYLWATLPVIITSFGFHVIIPSLTTYLHRDVPLLKKTIIWGSLIPLFIYILWEFVVLGILPIEGNSGLKTALFQGKPATYPLALLLQNHWISVTASFFSFFAIVTSFLGVTLSLSHFLHDGFKVKETGPGKSLVIALAFIPPLLFVLFYPEGFILALEYAGIFVALLLGIIPTLMAYRGRRIHKEDVVYRVKGGNLTLAISMIGFILVILAVYISSRGTYA